MSEMSRKSERRTETLGLVKKLTDERTEMLVLFCRVAGLEPYASHGPVKALLANFCEVLVDYIAAGHFALYERILNGRERRKDVVDVAQEIYSRIAQSTDAAVDFNDKYERFDESQFAELSRDLPALGETLAARIELEDRLLQALTPER